MVMLRLCNECNKKASKVMLYGKLQDFSIDNWNLCSLDHKQKNGTKGEPIPENCPFRLEHIMDEEKNETGNEIKIGN